jgi:leucyl-tRNA synthetase
MGNVHKKLILKYIETQAVILSPICPHVAEHIWELLGHKESILKSRWPTVPEYDSVLISAGAYLDQAAHEFRLRLKAYLASLTSKGAKKAVNVPTGKPTHGTIWIAKSYPTWQSIILTLLQERFNVKKSWNYNLRVCFSFHYFRFDFRKTELCLTTNGCQLN